MGGDQTKGRTSVLYPDHVELVRSTEHAVLNGLLAAWFYLTNRYTLRELRGDAALFADALKIGRTVLPLIDPVDVKLMNAVATTISDLEAHYGLEA